MLSKFAIGTALLGANAMDLEAPSLVKEDDLKNEFMSMAQRMRLADEWEKTNVFAHPHPLNETHKRKSSHPRVKTVKQEDLCTTAVNRLKAGPPTVASIIKTGTAWTDASFTGTDTLYWDVGTTQN
jgi:hypothetical protein